MSVIGHARAWIADDVDPNAAAELTTLADAADRGDPDAAAELADRFAAPLTFGTAGLRGVVRAGPNGMNRTVVRRTSAGISGWLSEHVGNGAVVVIGHDARHGSAVFAEDSAGVFAAAGFDVRLLPAVVPTPVLAFAVKALGADVGVMITASHNPARDNGYKVYGADGAQIVPPTDGEIESAIRTLGPSRDIALSDRFIRLDQGIVDAYVEAVAGLVSPPAAPIRIVHTAMHGVGTAVLARVFERAGYSRPISVPEQAEPDPDFPTVAFPNPEEKGALDLALALAASESADLLVASDPDADRCAVAVAFPSADGPRWRALSGDELGALLADHLMRAGHTGTYATTIVSSTLLEKMARRRGFAYVATLTGFKWITRAATDLVFGYEEALGYAVAPGLVRDKDGISAGLMAAELTAQLHAQNSSIPQRLEEMAAEFGRHTTGQISIRVDDLSRIGDTMSRLRAQPPTELRGHDVTVTDLSPQADVLTFAYTGGRVVVRPSGTEPKLKAYLEVVSSADAVGAATELDRLRSEVSALLGV
jgi:phosphomannomutase